MDQKYLNNYFSNHWKGNLDQYKYSGWNLISKVRDDEKVLDVGCGRNLFKGKIKNLIGIDPAFDESDYKITLEDFTPDIKFDVAFCLGSINFGDEEKIEFQIKTLVNLLNKKSKIFWRCNPGLQDHENEYCKQINFFNWSFDYHLLFSEKFNYTINLLKYDYNNRIYCEWISN